MEKKVIDKILRQMRQGSLRLTFWDGETRIYGKGKPSASIVLRNRSILKKALRRPSLAFGEAYMNGDIDIEGSVEDALKLAELNPMRLSTGSRRRQQRILHKNKKRVQRGYIAHHYDIGNDFYKLWLDPTMNYSCAYFKSLRDSLETAQKQKTDHLLRKLQLQPGMNMLDIGCGWGYLLIAAAKQYKVKGVGVSLSQEQIDYAKKRAKKEGVEHLVTFRLQNYLDLPQNQTFERIISVGFFEHVGVGNLDDYFKQVERLLKPEGISVLHSITHQFESPSDAWIDKYIFPGGYIPSVRETTSLFANHGFYLFDYENLGQHYSLTLEHWWKNYEKNKAKVLAMYDERFYRMWQLYLIGAMMAFRTGSTHLSQWIFKKGRNPSWPLTREYLYK